MSAGMHQGTAAPSRVSLIPIVASGVALFWLWHAVTLHGSGALSNAALTAQLTWLAALMLWGIVVSRLALSGRTRSTAVLSVLPGLWIPPLAVFATVAASALSPALRSAFLNMAQGVPHEHFLWVQALRIAAIGGVAKTYLGRLPPAFGYGIGVPDLVFGCSAVILAATGAAAALPAPVMMAWNVFGAAVFLGAPMILQLTLPGPLQIFRGHPDGRELLDFPMILAPSLLGPLLLIGNVLHIVKLTAAGCRP